MDGTASDVKVIDMRDSIWRMLGIALAVLGIVLLAAGAVAYAINAGEFVAVLIVFGGIFFAIGAGLAVVTLFEKEQVEDSNKTIHLLNPRSIYESRKAETLNI